MSHFIIIITFVVACFVLLFISRLVFDRFLLKRHNQVHLIYLKNAINAVIVTVCVYSCLEQFDITRDISKTLLQSGSLIIAVATFAAQQALGNIISGFAVSISKPFEVGQKVKVVSAGTVLAEGIITDITLRHTIIQQYDGQSCIVPNSIMDSSVIINTDYEGDIGNYMEIEISFDSDVDRAIEIFREICVEEPLIINKSALILVNRMTANGVVIKTTIWTSTVSDNFIACSNVRRELLRRFRKEGILIPYNTISIYNWKDQEESLEEIREEVHSTEPGSDENGESSSETPPSSGSKASSENSGSPPSGTGDGKNHKKGASSPDKKLVSWWTNDVMGGKLFTKLARDMGGLASSVTSSISSPGSAPGPADTENDRTGIKLMDSIHKMAEKAENKENNTDSTGSKGSVNSTGSSTDSAAADGADAADVHALHEDSGKT